MNNTHRLFWRTNGYFKISRSLVPGWVQIEVILVFGYESRHLLHHFNKFNLGAALINHVIAPSSSKVSQFCDFSI